MRISREALFLIQRYTVRSIQIGVLALSLLSSFGFAGERVLRCEAPGATIGHIPVPLRLDIVIPDSRSDLVVTTVVAKGGAFEGLVSSTRVARSTIYVTWNFPVQAASVENFPFVITSLGGAGSPLVGFFIVGDHVNAVRVNMNEPHRPFTFYDTYTSDEVATGKCI